MSKAKFAVVKELIEEERYAEARKILRGINHPTAKILLQELDDLAPEKTKGRGPFVLVSLFLVLTLVMAAMIVWQRPQLLALINQDEEPIPTLFDLTSASAATSTSTAPTSFPTLTKIPTAIAPTHAPTASMDTDAIRLSIYTFCMRKGEDRLCSEIASLPSFQQDSNVGNCFKLFAGALDDFGNCIHPQYTEVYANAWKRIYPSTVIPELCIAAPGMFGVPDNGNAAQVCTQHSRDMVSRNPYQIIDSCFDKYLAWTVVSELSDEEATKHLTNFALCVWQRNPID